MRYNSPGSVQCRVALAMALLSFVLLMGCQGRPAAVSRLQQQGEAGTSALRLMAAHGGLQRFLALADLQADVKVERYSPSGSLESTTQELHRFEAAPPSRYLLRRGAKRITEFGLLNGAGWVRIDGVLEARPAINEMATREVMLLQVLSRAPFCVADPGLKLTAMSDLPPQGEEGALHRLAVEFPALGSGVPQRYVFLSGVEDNLLKQVLFQPSDSLAHFPLQVARVKGTRQVSGVRLVTGWELLPADHSGHPAGLTITSWSLAQIRTGNGFTDELYRRNP